MPRDDTCTSLVRQYDKDRFLAALFAPAEKRPNLMGLYAFNAEINRIPRLVSEPQIGEIRLQWWAETIESMTRGETQEHPAAAALAACKLPQLPLLNLIEAHRFDLYADQMPSATDLEGYLGETSSALIQLACLILSPEDAPKAVEAAGLAGVAYGVARLLSTLPANRNIMPKDWDAGQLVSFAEYRYNEAKTLTANLPPILRPAFLPATLTGIYLQAARKNLDMIATAGFTVPQWRRQWHLWRAER